MFLHTTKFESSFLRSKSTCMHTNISATALSSANVFCFHVIFKISNHLSNETNDERRIKWLAVTQQGIHSHAAAMTGWSRWPTGKSEWSKRPPGSSCTSWSWLRTDSCRPTSSASGSNGTRRLSTTWPTPMDRNGYVQATTTSLIKHFVTPLNRQKSKVLISLNNLNCFGLHGLWTNFNCFWKSMTCTI